MYITIKALAIGVVLGYLVPWIFLKLVLNGLLNLGMESVFAASGIVVAFVILILSPFYASYTSAKFSEKLPMYHGIGAVSIALSFIIFNGNINREIFILVPYIITTLIFGYLGALKYKRSG